VSRTSRLLPWLAAPLLAALPALPAVAAPWNDPLTRAAAAPAPVRSPYPGKDASWDANEPQRRLAVYGDSLVMQTKPLLEALAGTRATAVDVWELSGAAPCDLLPTYGARVKAFAAERVELAFVGNATTGCMTSRIGGRPPGNLSPALRTRIVQVYETDLEAIVRWNRSAGVRTYLALPPVMAAQTWHGQLTAPLTAALHRLAARHPADVRLNTAPRDILTPGGTYRSTMVLNGRPVQLRHRDGTHLFAPVGTTLNAQALLWPLALED
jgi:hypothetical protein